MNSAQVYLDNNATTRCDPGVIKKMLPFFSENFGNPSNGLHRQGRFAGNAVEEAREQVANLIGATKKEIVFTSGATESNNLAIFGLVHAQKSESRKRIVTSAIEHKSVLNPSKKLLEIGFDVIFLPADQWGRIRLDAAEKAINEETLLVSIQAANNEIGTLQPIQEIANLAHKNGAVFHCDGAQALGKMEVDVHKFGIDLFSMSAHKVYGPKGIGALFINGGPRASPIEPILYGGGQEFGLRSGTLNVPGMVGFGEACRIAQQKLSEEISRVSNLRDHLEKRLLESIPDLKVNGQIDCRLPNTTSLTFPGIDADALILNLDSVMIGTGSACSSGTLEPSHVLEAIGLSREDAYSTVRISLGRFTDFELIGLAEREIVHVANLLR